jgi:hypothetical protein
MKDFRVGQIAYIILSKKKMIIPVKIVEQIIKRTENQEIIDWSLLIPDDDKPFLMSTMDDKVFSSIEDAKNYLIEQAKRSIQKMVEICIGLQNEAWPNTQVNSQVKLLNNNNKINSDNPDLTADKIKITLSDGTIANVKVPSIDDISSLTSQE